MVGIPAAEAEPPIELAQYRAVYDMTLQGGDELAISALAGRLVIEITGSACKGYTSTIRFVTEVEDPDGGREITDTRSTSFEGSDGDRFDFSNETYKDNRLVEESAGTAERNSDAISLVLTKPKDKTLELDDGVVFPTEQMTRTIEAAERGERFLQLDVFDGGEEGETVYQTATVIGAMAEVPDMGDAAVFDDAGFADTPHWPLTVSYFDKAASGDATPSYVMSMVLYRNGISRNLVIDYGDFSLIGTVEHLEMLPDDPAGGSCPL
jgi:hypothetical protein